MTSLTVFMPVYNGEKYLKEAIQSILKQTYTDFELLIIDDGSTDHTTDIINSFNDKRIRLVRNKTNKGLPYTRNKGIRMSKGKFIALMDSDDISHRQRLEKQLKYFKKFPETDIVSCFKKDIIKGSNNRVIESTIKRYIKNRLYRKQLNSPNSNIMLLFKCPIVNPGSMMKRSFIEKNNILYRDEYFVAQDYAFWMDCMLNNANIKILNEELLYYRSGDEHTNVTRESFANRAKERKKLIDSIRNRGLTEKKFKLTLNDLKLFNYFFQEHKYVLNEKNIEVFKTLLEKLQLQNKVYSIFPSNNFNFVLQLNWVKQIISSNSLTKKQKFRFILLYKWFNKRAIFYTLTRCMRLLFK